MTRKRTAPRLTAGLQANRAFTLIELLVVIGIIAVLAAIIFPVFATVRGKARQTTCQSNLRQIGMAFQMYVQDADGLAPYCVDSSDKTVVQMWAGNPTCKTKIDSPNMAWIHHHPDVTLPKPNDGRDGALDSYLKSRDLWRCAGDTGFDYLDNNDSCNGPCPMPARPTMYEAYGASYLIHTTVFLSQVPVDSVVGKTFDGKEVGPGSVNLIFDGNGSWHGSPLAIGRNGLRYVTLFLDGHAKFLTNDQYQEAWSVQFMPPGSSPCP